MTDDIRPEGREGMVMVYDSDDRYVGCMGIETWKRLEREEAAAAQRSRRLPAMTSADIVEHMILVGQDVLKEACDLLEENGILTWYARRSWDKVEIRFRAPANVDLDFLRPDILPPL